MENTNTQSLHKCWNITRYASGIFVLTVLILGIVTGFAMAQGGAEQVSTKNVVPKQSFSENSVQSVIKNQLEALKDGDSARVFSFMTPKAQEKFSDSDDYMDRLQEAYWNLYNHESYDFLEAKLRHQDVVIQKMNIMGPRGSVAMALYRLEKQDSGNWLIADYVVISLKGKSI